VAQTSIPAGSTPQQVEKFTQKYGLDRPLFEQFGTFLWMFLPGITLLGIYGTIGIRRPGNPHGILTKIVMALILLTNAITALNYLVVASTAEALSAAFWSFLAVAGLGLANFAFCLVVWNGYRWGMWSLGSAAFLMFILKFAGSVPIVPSLFELSAVVVLYFLIRPVWSDMD
jgi:ABC-type dipeptide/oligopeptide/nickel transport system permease component